MPQFDGKCEFRNSSGQVVLTIDPDAQWLQILHTPNGPAAPTMKITAGGDIHLWTNGPKKNAKRGARLNGRSGILQLGGNGQNGSVMVHDAAGNEKIDLRGETGDVMILGDLMIKNWRVSAPDYVFDESHELRTLDELKQFIAEHRHLPEIPSAGEIAESGFDVGKLCMLLLKKVEELTLYTLRQEQALRDGEKRLAALETDRGD